MKALSNALSARQKEFSYDPLLKMVLTKKGQASQTFTTDRILELGYTATPDSQITLMLLDNEDGELTALDLKGYQGVLSLGCVTGSEEYSARAPQKALVYQLSSSQGKLTCRLALVGIPDLMASDRANADETFASDDTNTVKDLIRKIAGDTGVSILSCFDHCTLYDVVFDSEDSLIDSFQPKNSFSIKRGETRWAKLNEVLFYTGCDKRVEADGKIHISVPKKEVSTAWVASTAYSLRDQVVPTTDNDYQYICTTAGTSGGTEPAWPAGIGKTVTDGTVVWTVSYDYKYSLSSEEHTFWNKTSRERIVIPNYVQVDSHPTHDETYTGFAKDQDSIDALKDDDLNESGEKRDYKYLRLSSDAQATLIATAILAHHKWSAETGYGFVPMNVGAEVHDLVFMDDSREDDTRVGNIGYLVFNYNWKSQKTPTMEFRFGKVFPGEVPGALLAGEIGGGTTLGDLYQYIIELYEMMELVASRTIVFGVKGTLVAEDNACFEIPVPENLVCQKVYINVKTPPTGSQLIVDVNLDGTTIFSSGTNRPKITAGLKVALSGTPDTVVMNKNQILSIDIDQVGSDDPGITLIVQIRCRLRGF